MLPNQHIDTQGDFSYFSTYTPGQLSLLTISMKPFDEPLHFVVTNENAELIDININTKSNQFIWVETIENKKFFLNKSLFKDKHTITQIDTDSFALPARGHQTPLMAAPTDSDDIINLLRKFRDTAGTHPAINIDAQWLINNKCNIAKDITSEEATIYYTDDEDLDVLANAWGVRVILQSGKDIFLPGMAIRQERWDDALRSVRNLTAPKQHPKINLMTNDGQECTHLPFDAAVIEYPLIFDAMHDVMHYNINFENGTEQ